MLCFEKKILSGVYVMLVGHVLIVIMIKKTLHTYLLCIHMDMIML